MRTHTLEGGTLDQSPNGGDPAPPDVLSAVPDDLEHARKDAYEEIRRLLGQREADKYAALCKAFALLEDALPRWRRR